jgi:hypothetical protein
MNSFSTFHYSFYLYSILKEPIPFEIQCKLLINEQKPDLHYTNCSTLTSIDNEQKYENKDHSYVVFRSLPIDVIRQLPSNFYEEEKSHVSSNDIQ